MVLERLRLTGRGKKGPDLNTEEVSLVRRDMQALRIARDIYFPGVDWIGMDAREKRDRYKRLLVYLQDLPTHIQAGDAGAININRSLANAGFNPAYAIEGCHFMLKKELKEVKTEKFARGGARRGGGGRVRGGARGGPAGPRNNDGGAVHNDVEIRPVGAVTGQVVNEHGEPIVGAHVVITDSSGSEVSPAPSETDRNGEFFIDNVPAGRIPWQPGTRVEAYRVDVQYTYTDERSHHPHTDMAEAMVVVTAGETNRTNPDVIRLHAPRSREQQIGDFLNSSRRERAEHPDRFGRPESYRGPGTALGTATKPFRLIAERSGHKIRTVIFSLFILVIGILISTVIGNMWFMAGFMFIALHIILPDPTENRMAENAGNLFFGSLLATRENRTNSGIAFLKAIAFVGIVVCFIFGLYTQPFPLSNLILLFLAFGFYFKMPIEFEPSKPYDFILSFCRVLLGLFIAIFIFGAFGAGMFQSRELGWLTLAFFVVLPVATEKNSLARALGRLGNASGQSYEMIDKLIFFLIMLFFAISYGFSFAGGFFSGTGGIVFSAVWVLGLVAGLTTPAETRPWMGALILIVGFVVFGLGAGQQIMGVAFFGEWWPTIHNGANEFFEPIGEMFGQFQATFGQSWLLFTNPVGYAQQITSGQFANNDFGVAGAYGLEIRKFDVHPVYIGEPFMMEIELENKGQFEAKNVQVEILTTIRDFQISFDPSPSSFNNIAKMQALPQDKTGQVWYKYTIDKSKFPKLADNIQMKDTVPILIYGMMSCADFKSSAWTDFGIAGGQEHTVREKYIPFVINMSYGYEATSNLQIDFISEQEWKRLSSEDKLVRTQKPSLLSTSPANLNLGSMDQPIRASTGFYIGFNLSNTWTQKSMIKDAFVSMSVPKGIGPSLSCSKMYKDGKTTTASEYFVYEFDLNKSASKDAVCSYNMILNYPENVPKKTYTIIASATYTFVKWDSKDTLFNFNDICWPAQIAAAQGSGTADGSLTIVFSDLSSENKVSQAKISNYLKTKGFNQSDADTLASAFYSGGVSSNIDPAFAVAVAQAETQLGKTGSGLPPANNWFGIMSSGIPVQFNSPQDGISRFYTEISRYVGLGQNTPNEIACASGSGFSNNCYCWESGPCSNWITNIPIIRRDVQATA